MMDAATTGAGIFAGLSQTCEETLKSTGRHLDDQLFTGHDFEGCSIIGLNPRKDSTVKPLL